MANPVTFDSVTRDNFQEIDSNINVNSFFEEASKFLETFKNLNLKLFRDYNLDINTIQLTNHHESSGTITSSEFKDVEALKNQIHVRDILNNYLIKELKDLLSHGQHVELIIEYFDSEIKRNLNCKRRELYLKSIDFEDKFVQTDEDDEYNNYLWYKYYNYYGVDGQINEENNKIIEEENGGIIVETSENKNNEKDKTGVDLNENKICATSNTDKHCTNVNESDIADKTNIINSILEIEMMIKDASVSDKEEHNTTANIFPESTHEKLVESFEQIHKTEPEILKTEKSDYCKKSEILVQKSEKINGTHSSVLEEENVLNIKIEDILEQDCSNSEAHNLDIHICKTSEFTKQNDNADFKVLEKEEEEFSDGSENKDDSHSPNSKSSKSEWDPSTIKDEVTALAQSVTEKMGYIFVEEYNMYYDYQSGYYYDPKTSLYYDCKSGTYFYYDQEANEYKFYDQVEVKSETDSCQKEPLEKQNEEENGSAKTVELKKDINEDTKKEINNLVHPSLRLMVLDTDLKGHLSIVTIDGGTIGREGSNHIAYLEHSSVSKTHAELCFKQDETHDYHYYVRSIAECTYVNGKKLLPYEQNGDWVKIGQGWTLKCGDVSLGCHVHPTHLTCNDCEPGLVFDRKNSRESKDSVISKDLEQERRRLNKVIKKKYKINWTPNSTSTVGLGYADRAASRRKNVGSDNPYEKIETASVETTIPSDNKGFKMLQKMGWVEGTSIGASQSGISEPIVPSGVVGRTGLGAYPSSIDQTPKSMRRKEILSKTQQRFTDAALLSETPEETEDINYEEIKPISIENVETKQFESFKFKPIKFTSKGTLDS